MYWEKNNFPFFNFWDMVDLKCEKCSQHFFFLKSSESYPEIFSLKSDEKKNWPHFSHFKSTISQKLIIGKLFFFGFSFFSIHNPSFRIIKSPLRIIKSKRLFLRGKTVRKFCRSLTRKGPLYHNCQNIKRSI